MGRLVGSLVAFLALAVGVPVALALVSQARFGSANPLAGVDPPWRWFADGDAALSEPIADDTFVDALVRLSLCVIWVAVAVIVVTTVVEVVHLVRHRGLPMPPVRGLGWAQGIARTIAVGLLVVMPTLSSSPSLAASIRATPVTQVPDLPSGARSNSASSAISPPAEVADPSADAPTSETAAPATVHVVQPGESVYSIAERIAGADRQRVIEIADAILDANLGATMGPGERFTNPAYLQVGWTLRIPAGLAAAAPPTPAPSPPAPPDVDDHIDDEHIYEVQEGDTLWDIAGEELGDPTEWTEIWEDNAGDDMGGGRTFDDPNLILPGWELTLDDDAHETAPAPDEIPVGEPEIVTAPPLPVEEPPADPDDIAPDPAAEVDRFDLPAEEPPMPGGPAVPDMTASASTAPLTDVNGPLPLSPDTDAPAVGDDTSTTTSSTAPPVADVADNSAFDGGSETAPDGPSPIRLEHAALLAAGILALVGVRRHRRLRAAMPRHRVPEPRPDVVETERRLRAVDAGERALRVDVACRAVAWSLIESRSQIGWVVASNDGDVEMRLTAPAPLPAPWVGSGQSWTLGAEVPIELLSEDSRQVGMPCVAFVQIGVTPDGGEVLVDLEACGVLAIEARASQADEVVAAVAAGLASSMAAEVAHLIGVSLPPSALLGHRNAHHVESADAALELAATLVGTTSTNERTSFELRSLRTGGEMWEPAVILLTTADAGEDAAPHIEPGHGFGVVVASDRRLADAPVALRADTDGWALQGFGSSVELTPIGLSAADLRAIDDVLADAEQPLEMIELSSVDDVTWADDPVDSAKSDDSGDVGGDASGSAPASPTFEPMSHDIVVGLLGSVVVADRDGNPGRFERSKTVELIAWLATHRERATRTGARTALWELDVRDATFANVVSEARRAMARLVAPPLGEEWVARTLTEQLPLHDGVVTDAQLVEERLDRARVEPPGQALETLRPAVTMIRDMPFAGTSYLWPDAEGITSNLVLLAITAAAEFAGHALSVGDTDGVFWATGQGLKVLPGHEELIGLRMRAHARSGDLAGVRQEWESYERVLVADAWSDGEPAPKLLALRRELLTTPT